jgi:signal transduction histidine kinase
MCDGELAIQSAPGAGTAVTITLPKEKNALC